MRKFIKYINIKLSSNKILSVFFLTLIFCFLLFINFITKSYEYNYYDLVINLFGYLNLFYFFSFFFLIIIYNYYNNNLFNTYLNFRFKSKNEIYNINVISICSTALIFIVSLNLIIVLQCIGNIDFKNTFSPYFFKNMTGTVNLFYTKDSLQLISVKLTPLKYIFILNIYIFFYLITLGLIFLIGKILFKNSTLSFIVISLLILINLWFDSASNIVSKLTFTHNIYFITSSYNEIQNNFYLISRFIYWILLIFLLYCLGNIFNKKFDYLTGE